MMYRRYRRGKNRCKRCGKKLEDQSHNQSTCDMIAKISASYFRNMVSQIEHPLFFTAGKLWTQEELEEANRKMKTPTEFNVIKMEW